MVDELGDVLFQVIFLSLLLEERGLGDLGDVAEACTAKLVRRHPHVFGDRELETADQVLGQWEEIKREVEGGDEDPLAGIPENLPSLTYARKVLRRLGPEGSSAGEKPGGPSADPGARDAAEAWLGQLLLAATVLSRRLGVDPELALRAAADRLASPSSG